MDQLWAPWRMEYIKSAIDKDEGCIFCLKPGEKDDRKNLIPFRSKHCYIILNKYPYNNGHLLIVPYKHESDFTALSAEILEDINATLKKAIDAINKTMNPHGMNIGINLGRTAGAGIDDHLHYHLVPRWDGDTNFMPVLTGTKVVSEALEQTWEKLHRELG